MQPSTTPIPSTLVEEITRLTEQVLPDESFYLVEVTVRGRTGSQSVNVYIDADTGITVEQCAEISRELSFLMETAGLMQGIRQFNVSSPGVDRPLILPRQFRKNIGRPLKVLVQTDGATEQAVTGTLVETTDEGLVLEAGEERRPIRFSDIRRAQVQLPW